MNKLIPLIAVVLAGCFSAEGSSGSAPVVVRIAPVVVRIDYSLDGNSCIKGLPGRNAYAAARCRTDLGGRHLGWGLEGSELGGPICMFGAP